MQRSRKINAPLILNPDFPTDSLAHSSFVFHRKASRAEWNTLTSHRTGRRSPCGLVHCCRGPEAASRAARQLCVAGAWGGGGAVCSESQCRGKRDSTLWLPGKEKAKHVLEQRNPAIRVRCAFVGLPKPQKSSSNSSNFPQDPDKAVQSHRHSGRLPAPSTPRHFSYR